MLRVHPRSQVVRETEPSREPRRTGQEEAEADRPAWMERGRNLWARTRWKLRAHTAGEEEAVDQLGRQRAAGEVRSPSKWRVVRQSNHGALWIQSQHAEPHGHICRRARNEERKRSRARKGWWPRRGSWAGARASGRVKSCILSGGQVCCCQGSGRC